MRRFSIEGRLFKTRVVVVDVGSRVPTLLDGVADILDICESSKALAAMRSSKRTHHTQAGPHTRGVGERSIDVWFQSEIDGRFASLVFGDIRSKRIPNMGR
jgi:hypothetical protein